MANPDSILDDERREAEEQIRLAFKGVTRAGGISWSETRHIDDYSLPADSPDRVAARAADNEHSWEDLVEDDAIWEPSRRGSFAFLDPIGFRYYLGAAMIRCLRRGCDDDIDVSSFLTIKEKWHREKTSLINDEQARAIARFIRVMITLTTVEGDEIWGSEWRSAYRYWKQWDDGGQQESNG